MTQPDSAVPAKLAWIIARALQKDPARRYPDAEVMLRDLRSLHADLKQRTRDLPSWVVARRRWLGWFGAGILVLAGGTLALILLRAPPQPAHGLPPGKPVPLTSGVALDTEPAISPDGSRNAFTCRVDGQADIYVVDAHGGDPLRLTHDPRDDYSPAWFPDGSSLAFVSERRGSPDIWKTGQHGGGATLVLADGGAVAAAAAAGPAAFACGAGRKASFVVDTDGSVHGCSYLVRARRSRLTRAARRLAAGLTYGHVADPDFAARWREPAAASSPADVLRRTERMGEGRPCAGCALDDACSVCPVAGAVPGVVPDAHCLFARLAHRDSIRFQERGPLADLLRAGGLRDDALRQVASWIACARS